MKIEGQSGEFAFKALIKYLGSSNRIENWTLSDQFFFLKEDVIFTYGGTHEIKWPCEVYDDGTVYIPSEDELK